MSSFAMRNKTLEDGCPMTAAASRFVPWPYMIMVGFQRSCPVTFHRLPKFMTLFVWYILQGNTSNNESTLSYSIEMNNCKIYDIYLCLKDRNQFICSPYLYGELEYCYKYTIYSIKWLLVKHAPL